MTTGHGYVRMLAPPDHARCVDVPDRLVPEKLRTGFVPDPLPDRRPERHRSVPGSHRGCPALVCASGPSAGLVGRDALLAFAAAEGCVVWGTNNVWEVCDGLPLPCDYVVVLDIAFWRTKRPEFARYLAEHPDALPVLAFEPDRDKGFPYPDYLRIGINLGATAETDPPYEVNRYFYGASSGIAAVQMAMHCGCNPIYLIGHDCGTAHGRTHGSGVRSAHELRKDYPQGLTMLAGYEILARHAARLGVEIVNLSPVSRITCFPRAELVLEGDGGCRKRGLSRT